MALVNKSLAQPYSLGSQVEPDSYIWSCTNADNWASAVVCIRGENPSSPIDVASLLARSGVVTAITNVITPSSDKRLIIAAFEQDAVNAGLLQAVSGGTVTGAELVSVQESTAYESIEIQSYAQSAVAPISLAARRSVADSSNWATAIIAVSPAAGGFRTFSISPAIETDVGVQKTTNHPNHYSLTPAVESDMSALVSGGVKRPPLEFRFSVRERAPLRLHALITTPNNKFYRWGIDAPHSSDVMNSETHSATIPGGFENCNLVLKREPYATYDDLTELSNIRIQGVGGMVAWEGRLEQLPRISGDDMAITPGAVGWQAALDDNKAVQYIYVDGRLSQWQDASLDRRINVLDHEASDYTTSVAVTSSADVLSGSPALELSLTGPFTRQRKTEAWYDAGGTEVKMLVGGWRRGSTISASDYNWYAQAGFAIDDGAVAYFDGLVMWSGAGPIAPFAEFSITAAGTAAHHFCQVQLVYTTGLAAQDTYPLDFAYLSVFGPHGLPMYQTNPLTYVGIHLGGPGLLGSDILKHLFATFVPSLKIASAGVPTISTSTFVIPQAAYLDPTTAGDIIKDISKYDLQDWAVWEDKTFWWYPRGTLGNNWRVRSGPSKLSEAGPQVDRMYNGVVVRYTDVAGITRSVGPPGSNVNAVYSLLHDSDPLNPVNVAGLARTAVLTIGVNTASGAYKIGQAFLAEQKLLNNSGSATLVGHIADDKGALWPAWMVRPGDQISFIDAHDPSYRRIVQTSWNDDSKEQQITLDSPPQGLQAFLERLNAKLTS